jgi:hypothetical protein
VAENLKQNRTEVDEYFADSFADGADLAVLLEEVVEHGESITVPVDSAQLRKMIDEAHDDFETEAGEIGKDQLKHSPLSDDVGRIITCTCTDGTTLTVRLDVYIGPESKVFSDVSLVESGSSASASPRPTQTVKEVEQQLRHRLGAPE